MEPNRLLLLLLALPLGATTPAQSQTLSQALAPTAAGPTPPQRPATGSAAAQASPAPAYQSLRYEEDWSYLRAQPGGARGFERLKYRPLGAAGVAYLSLGGQARLRYERRPSQPGWGPEPTSAQGYFQQRYLLHADAHLGPHLRVFGQLSSGLESGPAGPPLPLNVNQLDVGQLFMEARVGSRGNRGVALRVGHQEMTFGAARLVGTREPLNVRRGFEGLRATATARAWRGDAFLTRPVQTKAGVFDDSPNREQTFWGAYVAGPAKLLPGGHVDMYYFGLKRQTALFAQGPARELRHSAGARLWGKQAGWDYDADLLYQWGHFGPGALRAWGLLAGAGYTPPAWPARPRLGLRLEGTSGDGDPRNPDLQTFNALFPRGAYFLEPVLVGPSNYLVVDPSLELHPADQVRIVADASFYWRQRLADGVYNNTAAVQRPDCGNPARLVGRQANLTVQWQLNRHVTWVGLFSHFSPGPFLRATGPARPVNYLTSWVAFTF